ncbi:uncharacterized protein J3R85_013932 [Psidium guajava]|nr:uncharacterized protein J3R85_013932 [Psidium guajava]
MVTMQALRCYYTTKLFLFYKPTHLQTSGPRCSWRGPGVAVEVMSVVIEAFLSSSAFQWLNLHV